MGTPSEAPKGRPRIQAEFGGPLPIENVTGQDYEIALENLKRFSVMDLSEIATLEDLSFQMMFVAPALRAVVLSSGGIQELKLETTLPEGEADVYFRSRELKEPLSDGNFIKAGIMGNSVHITKSNPRGTYIYDAGMPLTGIITVDPEPYSQMNIMIAQAVDWRGWDIKSFFPAHEPHNPTVHRGFAGIVQEGVQHILQVAKSPTKLPPLK